MRSETISKAKGTILSGAFLGVLAGAVIAYSSYFTVDQGGRGVVTTTGRVTSVAGPGFHLKFPFIETVHHVSIRTETQTWEKVNAYSADQQPADVKVSVTYHVDPARAEELYSQFGTIENAIVRVVGPHLHQQLKVVFGGYTAVRSIQERGKFNTDVRAALAAAMGADTPLVIESVQIENIDFSKEYIKSVEARMQAEVEVQKLQQQALQAKVQAQITVTEAQASADSQLAQARANAEAVRVKGDADAYAQLVQAKSQAEAIRLQGEATASSLSAKGEALKANATLIQLIANERWDGKLPATMVPGGALPFLQVK